MSNYPQNSPQPWQLEYGRDQTGAGSLASFFNAVYAWMAVGLGVTALVAFGVSQNPGVLKGLTNGPMIIVFMLGSLVLSFVAQAVALRVSAVAGLVLFLLYAACLGVMLSGLFAMYSLSTLAAAFIVTAGTFGAMSVYGMVTKRDLTGIGSMLFMAMWGLFFASIANVFFASNALSWVITYAVLAVVIGITAYQTQMLKNLALQHAGDSKMTGRIAVVGSLLLYIAFINMFLSIVRILGDRR